MAYLPCKVCGKIHVQDVYESAGMRRRANMRRAKEKREEKRELRRLTQSGGSMGIKKVGDYIYEVPSGTDYNKKYLVTVNPGEDVTCTCTGYATTRNAVNAGKPNRRPFEVQGRRQSGYCKHIKELFEDRNLKVADLRRVTQAREERDRIARNLESIIREMDEA